MQFIFLTLLLIFCNQSYAQEIGIASWYSIKSSSNITANGEQYKEDGLTCASNDYKFGTFLKVTNFANNKFVIVRVNDRGNFKKYGRIIDLSKGAFRQIGNLEDGLIKVRIDIYK